MRVKQLDILRALAVLLVIGRHSSGLGVWTCAGWSGVDLFFVLSGFLISGLLFAEYKQHGVIRPARFLIRRGFKIYPGFYVLIGITAALNLLARHPEPANHFVGEVFFLQGYLPRVWNHTWSLAVEEHFYLVLPFLLVLLLKTRTRGRNPFHALLWIYLGLAAAILALRSIWLWTVPEAEVYDSLVTHFYLDGLMFGVLLSYYYHFHAERLEQFVERYRLVLAAVSAILLAPVLVLDFSSRYLLSVGHLAIYLGFGLLLLLVLPGPATRRQAAWTSLGGFGGILAAVGAYSYSIYLWHVPVHWWGTLLMRRVGMLSATAEIPLWIYLPGSLALGIAMARLVEMPALALRDRVFPSRSLNPVALASEGANGAEVASIAAAHSVAAAS